MEQQELQALLGSLRQGQQAKQSLPGLTDRRAEAAALRDQPIAEIDKTSGYMSPFAALAGVMKQDRGRKEVASLDPRIAQAQEQVGGAASGLQEYGLKQALAKQQLAAQHRTEDQGIAVKEWEAKKALDEKKMQNSYEITKMQNAPKDPTHEDYKQYVDEDGNIIQVSRKGGETFAYNEEGDLVQRSLDGLKEYEEKDELKANKIFKDVKTPHIKMVVGANRAIRTVNRINKQIETFTPEDIASLTADPDLMTTIIAKGTTPSDVNSLISGKRFSPAVKEYLASLNQFSGKIRNQLYGSALTAAEIKLSDLWLPSANGITLEDAQSRMGSILDEAMEGVSALDDSYGEDFTGTLPKRYLRQKQEEAKQAEVANVSPERQIKIDRLAELKAKQAAGG